MTSTRPAVFAVGMALLACAGCSSLDVAPSGDPDRLLTGTVRTGSVLPTGAEIVVRLLAMPVAESARPPAAELPIAPRPVAAGAERVLAEFTTTLAQATNQPVPFSIPFHADDAMLRRGLNLEARVSVAGRLKYRTINAHAVTLNSSRFPQEVVVQPVGP